MTMQKVTSTRTGERRVAAPCAVRLAVAGAALVAMLGCKEVPQSQVGDASAPAAQTSRADLGPQLPAGFDARFPRLAMARTLSVTTLPKGWIVNASARGLTIGAGVDLYKSGALERGWRLASSVDLGRTQTLHFEKGAERGSVTLMKRPGDSALQVNITYSAP